MIKELHLDTKTMYQLQAVSKQVADYLLQVPTSQGDNNTALVFSSIHGFARANFAEVTPYQVDILRQSLLDAAKRFPQVLAIISGE
jgi:hypothetical protein